MELLRTQWERMGNVDWAAYFGKTMPKTSVELWTRIWLYEVGQERRFQEIAEFALRVLSTPLSNAVVERAFSILNVVKSKLRNKLQTKMLEALMRLRLWARGVKCCAAFTPTEAMYKLFTKDMYDNDAGASGGGEEQDIEEIWHILDEADD